jgi:phage baseplate assembly protein V
VLQGKWGKVSEHGPKGFVRVEFPADDNMPSPMLPVGYQWTGHVKVWNPPPLGLRVFCLLSDHGESGLVAFAAYTESDTPPSESLDVFATEFADGTVIQYDQATHKLTADLGGAGGSAEVNAPGGLAISANVTITGTLDVSGAVGVGGSLGVDGNGMFGGSASGSDFNAGPISLTGHKHLGNLGALTSPAMP